MELKKNPNKDLNKNRALFFVVGLVSVMLMTYVVLEWKTYDTPDEYAYQMNQIDDSIDEDSPILVIKTLPPPPPPVAPVIISIIEDEDDKVETEVLTTEANEDTVILEVEDIEEVDEIIDELIPFTVIENVPVFPGCENDNDKRACFQKMMIKHVRKNQRYPEIAQEIGLEGRVNVIFVIQKDGSIGGIKFKGPHQSLEKEAVRVINVSSI